MPICNRRDFIACACSLVAGLTACADGAVEPQVPPPDPESFQIFADHVRVDLARAGSLSPIGGTLVLYPAPIIIVHNATDEYRAFSNICTHSGCGISVFVHPRFRCQCHGSEFDLEGINVAGPAPAPLRRFVTSRDPDGSLRVHLD